MAILIDEKLCNGCGLCDVNCPGDLIFMDEGTQKPKVLYPEECWYCGACRMDCPKDCIKIVFPLTSL
ncbi:MAG: 4Fe-4S ferredoxin [Clostridiaceae bacterium BRH_c20a]|nr:MAG: 4Fe-4S ferredoxin [Clostridiaceae bacterium BRH_c20a]